MTYGIVILIFVVGFLVLYAAFKYGENPILKTCVYLLVMFVFVVVLLDLAGLLPVNFLNRNV